MGLLFDNFESKSVVRRRKQGFKERYLQGYKRGFKLGLEQAREQAHIQINEWVADNPEVKKLIDEGRVSPPPYMYKDWK